MAIIKLSNAGVESGTKYSSMLAGNSTFYPGSFEFITKEVLVGSAASITFSSIPQYYQHLQLRIVTRSNDTIDTINNNLRIRFNSDTGNNYSRHGMLVQASSRSSYGSASQNAGFIGAVPCANTTVSTSFFGSSIVDILDYRNTSKKTTVRTINGYDDNAGVNERLTFESSLWNNTAAVSTIQIFTTNGSLIANTQASLYGIRGA